VIGELVPKGIALGYPERTALAVSAPVRGFFVLFAPLVWILQKATASVLHLLNLRLPGVETEAHSEAELKMLVRSSSDAGEIEQGEREMLYKVFDFADKEVHEVMVPRPEVVAIKADLPPEEALAALLESPFTRYPVYRESLDEIIGVVHVRDLFAALHDRGIEQVEIEQLLRPVYIVPETKDLGALLAEFRKQNQHMAVVVDEYGAMEGIVTLEDLLEEIVGEIEDEFDLPDESVERIDDAHIRIHGTFPIDDFNEEFGTEIEAEDYHTMAGIVFGAIGRAPEVGDTVTIDGLNLAVIEIEGSRIQRLEVEFQEKLPEPEGEGE
jgi:putative hemolysin